jgi:signal transduction histidine kinase
MQTQTEKSWVQSHNLPGLKSAAWLALIFVPLTWAFDWWYLPDHVQTTGWLRAMVAASGALVLLMIRGVPGLTRKHVDTIAEILCILVAGSAGTVSFLHDGYESDLFIGLILVFVVVGQLFTWSTTRAAGFYLACLFLFAEPWVLGWVEPVDLHAAAARQVFLIGAAVLCLIANQSRLASAKIAFARHMDLEQARHQAGEALKELRDLDRLKSGFFASIVETIRGPLTLMVSPLDSMLAGDVGSFRANQIEYLETVRRNALRVLKLTDDLVDLSHLEGGLLRLQPERTDLVGMLRGVVDHAQGAAKSKQITVSFESEVDRLDLYIDAEKLERAITHIVAAAITSTGTDGRIDLRVKAKGAGAELSIRDNGAGLPPDWLKSFMAERDQGKWLPPRSPDGIGLVLAQAIVKLHGGAIDVVSRPETGTSFTIKLQNAARGGQTPPADDLGSRLRASTDYRYMEIDSATIVAQVDHAPSESKATKVLVVDDNPEILRFTQSLLSKDHSVFVAADGEAGLALAIEEQPDVVITDTRMPKLDGPGLIRAMRQEPKTAQIPTIMLTARNQAEDRETARESGADTVLEKPFNPRELRAAIRELVRKTHSVVGTVQNAQTRSFEMISAGLAHEMHNPLGYISGAFTAISKNAGKIAAAMDDEALDDDARKAQLTKAKKKIDEMLPIASRGIKRITELIELMRRYAREGYSSDSVEIHVDEAIGTVLEMIAPKGDAQVSIESDLKAPEVVIKAVPEELQQAITNLTQNAIDAVGKGGHVWVRSRAEDRAVCIEVSDDGPGIPKEQLSRIFTPFFTTKEVGKGMGLGLTITRQVIKQHGGTLDVHSTPGEGTTFTIRLPLASMGAQDDAPKSALEQAAEIPETKSSATT